jgi:hypothetical protein
MLDDLERAFGQAVEIATAMETTLETLATQRRALRQALDWTALADVAVEWQQWGTLRAIGRDGQIGSGGPTVDGVLSDRFREVVFGAALGAMDRDRQMAPWIAKWTRAMLDLARRTGPARPAADDRQEA